MVTDEINEDMVRRGPAASAKRFEVGGLWQMGLESGFCESLNATYKDLWDL
jgi:hypothetical protein